MPLCEACTHLPAEWLIPRAYDFKDSEAPDKEPIHYWTYPSWAELEASARSCELCAVIVNESVIDTSGPYQKTDKQGICFILSGGSRIEVWCPELNRVSKFNVGFDREDLERLSPATRKMFDARIVSKRAGDERNIRSILHWMRYCQENHKHCSAILEERDSPTRVIDVGTIDQPSLRLLAGENKATEYATLSYCWGRTNNYMTTKSNLTQHMSSIELDDLPPAIQDAIMLVRLLGLRYIWIDALCIIQDDRNDWMQEASKMHNVYSHATLTIAADMLEDTSSRLFVDRSMRHNYVVPLLWPLEKEGDKPLYLYVLPNFSYFSDAMARMPLSRRGWSFQERALSTRILHMGDEMCYWECKETCIGEDDEIGKYNVIDDFYHLRDLVLPSRDGQELTMLKMQDNWAWVIKEYSKRKLTVDGDRFAALEGITTLFGAKEKLGKHFCGLWENEFLRHLLWVCVREGINSNHRRPSAYRAPSWSWVSVEGPVKNAFIETAFVRTPDGGLQLMQELGNDGVLGTSNLLSHRILTINSIEVETEGETSYGSVLRAHLKVSGALVPIKRGKHIQKGLYVLETLAGDAVGGAVWDVDDYGLQKWSNLWICPVMQCRDASDGWSMSECLVLKSADGSDGQSMVFERLAKGRTKNFFVKHLEILQFTII